MTVSDGSLLAFLESSRWFAGKGRSATLRSVTPLPWLRPPGEWPAVRIEIVEVGYPDAHAEYYQLPLAYRPETDAADSAVVRRIEVDDHGALAGYDATDQAEAGSVILGSLLAGASLGADDHEVEFVPEPVATALPADLSPSRLTGEQSNTSIRYGDRALLKLFRRLKLGDNLDITVHRAMNEADATDAGQALRADHRDLADERHQPARRSRHADRAVHRRRRRLATGGRGGGVGHRLHRRARGGSARRWPGSTGCCGRPFRPAPGPATRSRRGWPTGWNGPPRSRRSSLIMSTRSRPDSTG